MEKLDRQDADRRLVLLQSESHDAAAQCLHTFGVQSHTGINAWAHIPKCCLRTKLQMTAAMTAADDKTSR